MAAEACAKKGFSVAGRQRSDQVSGLQDMLGWEPAGVRAGPSFKAVTMQGFPPRHVMEDALSLTCPVHGASSDVIKEMSVVLGPWQRQGRRRTALRDRGAAGSWGASTRGEFIKMRQRVFRPGRPGGSLKTFSTRPCSVPHGWE